MEINIIETVSIDEKKATLLSIALKKLIQFALSDIAGEYFNTIYIVNGSNFEESVNELLAEYSDSRKKYKMGSHIPYGIAIPIISQDRFIPVIILSDKLINELDEDHLYSFSFVSTLLEELLHISTYCYIYKKYGRLDISVDTFLVPLYEICQMMHDEYYVNKKKAAITMGNALIEIGGAYSPCGFSSEYNLPEVIEHGYNEINDITAVRLR